MASSWLHHSEVTHSRSSEFASIWLSPSATAASARVSHQCFLSQLWETCSLGAATLCQRLISQGRHASSPPATLCSITCKLLESKVPCTKDRGLSQRTPSLLLQASCRPCLTYKHHHPAKKVASMWISSKTGMVT